MKKYFCDIPDCNEEAWELKIKLCHSFYTSMEFRHENKTYEPFERPIVHERDLCREHYKEWCKATYNAFYKEAGG